MHNFSIRRVIAGVIISPIIVSLFFILWPLWIGIILAWLIVWAIDNLMESM